MGDTTELLRNRRTEIMQIAARHGARNLRVFGSVARGDTRPDSDVDFLVDMEPGRSLFDLGGLLYDLQALLGVDVDVVTEKGLRSRIRAQVMREAAPLAEDAALWAAVEANQEYKRRHPDEGLEIHEKTSSSEYSPVAYQENIRRTASASTGYGIRGPSVPRLRPPTSGQ
jgi:predicted nucleotidyltransferase